MTVGYLDTSCLVAVAFDEPEAGELARRIEAYDALVSANLLEAEFRSALQREGAEAGAELLSGLAWVLPDRPLSLEIERVLGAHYLRGADLWHLATALYVADAPGELDFLTLDADQRVAAAALGFPTPLFGA